MRIRIFVGTGGVGKTSVTAASALASALDGKKSLVLTIDPARRLKTALGLESSGPEPTQQRVTLDSAPPGGELWAALLDVRTTMDRMVRTHGGNKAQAILEHPVYRLLITSLAGMNELVAVERIDQAIADGFENLFIDTAPSRHTFEFLDKPEYFIQLVSLPLVKLVGRTWDLWRNSPLGRSDPSASDLYSRLQQLVGATLITQVLDFFSIFHPVAEGYAKRSKRTIALLRDSRTTGFTIVTTAGGARRDGNYLFAELTKRNYQTDSLILNRVWPRLGLKSPAEPAAVRELVQWCESVVDSQRGILDQIRPVWMKKGVRVIDLPELAGDADGLAALRLIAQNLKP